jgi:peptidyl-prolyl cis-trans isomerase D
MLDSMRKNAQSWMIKALFAIIVLVFVFWGVGGFQGKEKRILATVNEQEIASKEFFRYYERQLDSLRQRSPNVDTEQLKQMDFKRQLFESMVNNLLLEQKAAELGVFVSVDELRSVIRTMQAFQTANGTFDRETYNALLRQNNLSPAQFEGLLRQDILRQKLRSYILEPAKVSESEARDLFGYVQEKASLEYLEFSWREYVDQVQVSDEEVAGYFEEHKEQFRVPPKIAVDYLLITPKALAEHQEVTAEEVEAYYARNKQLYSQQEQVKARHILIEVEEAAPESEVTAAKQKIEHLAERIAEGEDFAGLARQESEGPSSSQGGQLGWFGRESMVEPFSEAAFALDVGQVSQPVRTRFGFHLIKVEDRREPGIKPLKDVRAQVEEQLAQDMASDRLENTLDTALEALLGTGSLEKAAEAVPLSVQSSSLFTRQQGLGGISLEQEDLERLFSLKKGELTDTPLMLENGYLLARKTEEVPSQIRPLGEVRSQIEARLQKDKAMNLARKAAEKALSGLKADRTELDSLGQTTTSDPFSRRGPVPGLGENQDLVRDAFAVEEGSWLDTVYQTQDGYVLARLVRLTPPDESAWKEQKSFWVSNMSRTQSDMLMQAFVQGLRKQAEIEVLSPEVLEY